MFADAAILAPRPKPVGSDKLDGIFFACCQPAGVLPVRRTAFPSRFPSFPRASFPPALALASPPPPPPLFSAPGAVLTPPVMPPRRRRLHMRARRPGPAGTGFPRRSYPYSAGMARVSSPATRRRAVVPRRSRGELHRHADRGDFAALPDAAAAPTISRASVCGCDSASPTECTGPAGTLRRWSNSTSHSSAERARRMSEIACVNSVRWRMRSLLSAKRGSCVRSDGPKPAQCAPEVLLVRAADDDPRRGRREGLVRRRQYVRRAARPWRYPDPK